jgi:DNA invertase Pin-like site-specific DNA recombinase
MRLTDYLRVSSVSQIDAWGLDRQETAIRAWAKGNNRRIVSWHRDEGVPGTIEAVDRPGCAAAIQEVGPKVDGILVADLDRSPVNLRSRKRRWRWCGATVAGCSRSLAVRSTRTTRMTRAEP